jgi:hypothetical protein
LRAYRNEIGTAAPIHLFGGDWWVRFFCCSEKKSPAQIKSISELLCDCSVKTTRQNDYRYEEWLYPLLNGIFFFFVGASSPRD